MNLYWDKNKNKELIFWDKEKVELRNFIPEGKTKPVHFFKSLLDSSKIISRSAFGNFRDPFSIEPWNQILIDFANKYGSKVDEDINDFFNEKKTSDEALDETKMSIGRISKSGLKWVARGQMICHKDSLIYGEVDEIWYCEKDDIYYVGDTKTASSVDKISYWYQIAVYIEILKSLNPDKNFSPLGIINWVYIKKHKWIINREFNESSWEDWIGKTVTPEDEVYNARWTLGTLEIPEIKNQLKVKDLNKYKILDLVKSDLELIKKYNIASIDVLNNLNENDESFISENKINQNKYDEIKNLIINENKNY